MGRWRKPGPGTVGVLALAALATALAASGDPCRPGVEENDRWASARVRVHTDAFTQCSLDEAGYNRVIARWLAARDPARPLPRSIGLGRLVDHPWIADHLARAALDHPAWDARQGRARQGHDNAAVAALLSAPAFLARLRRPLAGHGVSVSGVSVEKVLVDDARGVIGDGAPPGRRVPFDAQAWLVIGVDR